MSVVNGRMGKWGKWGNGESIVSAGRGSYKAEAQTDVVGGVEAAERTHAGVFNRIKRASCPCTLFNFGKCSRDYLFLPHACSNHFGPPSQAREPDSSDSAPIEIYRLSSAKVLEGKKINRGTLTELGHCSLFFSGAQTRRHANKSGSSFKGKKKESEQKKSPSHRLIRKCTQSSATAPNANPAPKGTSCRARC